VQSGEITSAIDFSLLKPNFENRYGDKWEDHAMRRGEKKKEVQN
jgi:hypothetical protein